MDGYEVCRRHPRGPGDGVPAGRDGHRQRRPGEAAGDRGRAPTTSSPSRSTRPSCSPGSARCVRIKRYHDTIERAGRRAGGVEPRARAARGRRRWTSCERLGRLRRFLSPQLADLVVDSGDESFLESHRREITVVFCDLRGFTAVRRDGRARGGHGGPPRVPRGARRPDLPLRGHARAVRRRRAHGLLQRPAPVRRTRPLRAVRMAVAMREPGRATWPRAGAAWATTWASASASPRATPRSAGSASRAASTTPRSAASPTSPRGCAPRPSRGRSSSPSGCTPAAEDVVVAEPVGELDLRGFTRPVARVRRQGPRRGRGDVVTARHRGAGRPALARRSTRSERYAAFDRLQARMPDVWRAMRLNQADESVVVVPSITLDRASDAAGR